MLVVDLTEVGFLGSASLASPTTARGAGTAVRVVATGRAVMRPLQVTGLTGLLPISGSVEQALTS